MGLAVRPPPTTPKMKLPDSRKQEAPAARVGPPGDCAVCAVRYFHGQVAYLPAGLKRNGPIEDEGSLASGHLGFLA